MLTGPHHTSLSLPGLLDDPLVARAATRLLARHGDQRTRGADGGSRLVAEAVFVQHSGGSVADHSGDVDAVLGEAERSGHGILGGRSLGTDGEGDARAIEANLDAASGEGGAATEPPREERFGV